MPLKFVVEFDDDGSAAVLGELRSRVGAMAELHEAMGMSVLDLVRLHIVTNKKSPNTGWWARVADRAYHTFNADGAEVILPEPGSALRYYGGTVRQRPGGPLLTLPTKDVPGRNQTRAAARDMGVLAFLPSRKPKTAGYLVEGEAYQTKRGKLGKRPKKGGKLLYILRTETHHNADPSVLPTDQQIAEAARDAALDYVATDLN